MSELFGMRCVAPLFVPGNRPDRFEKAAASDADAIIIDLEDAVPPVAKNDARSALRTALTTRPILVRINAIGTPWHGDDLAAVDALAIDGILLPKAEAGPDLDRMATRHPIVALIETAQGLSDARKLAADPRVVRLAFGSLDYCIDLGCAHTRDALLLPRSELVFASRLARLSPPLDGVTAALHDVLGAEDDARSASQLGFGGKMCIHPRQVSAVLRGFQPSDEEIAWAEQVGKTGGVGVEVVADTMVDAPVRSRALAILARAGRAAEEDPQNRDPP